MYKIVGADQEVYGPVTAEELRRWIAEGRANAQTPVQREGSGEWKPLGTLPEFAAAFAATPPVSPAVFPTTVRAPVGTNGMATAGLVLSIVGLLCCGCGLPFSTLGLIFSGIGLSQIDRNPMQSGRALAIAGIVLSLFGFFLMAIMLVTGNLRGSFRFHH
ncbi:MAG: domain containing protein [Pedosphaera sp.]|nr:domain containing protein [Pedosphaera sp.]